MALPFTVDQFLGVFRDYNISIWPIQIAAYILGISAAVLAFSDKEKKDRIISFILSILWLWNGVVYHLINFSRINKLAYLFGILFLVQGFLFFFYGTIKNKIAFGPKNNYLSIIGTLFIIYAAVIYPLIGYILGHGYPYSPQLGVAPCPTTILTLGLILLAGEVMPLKVIWIPLLWSLIGTSASWNLGIWEDIGMTAAALFSISIIIYGKRRHKQEGTKTVIVEKVIVR